VVGKPEPQPEVLGSTTYRSQRSTGSEDLQRPRHSKDVITEQGAAAYSLQPPQSLIVLPRDEMKKRTKSILKGMFFVVALWLALLFIVPAGEGARGRAEVTRLRAEAHQLDGVEMTELELRSALSSFHLELRTNRYTPDVQFQTKTNWTVRLMPDNRKSYVNPHALLYSIAFLRFDKMEFPDIEFGCPGGQNKTNPFYCRIRAKRSL
jgi:hypothetical protein